MVKVVEANKFIMLKIIAEVLYDCNGFVRNR